MSHVVKLFSVNFVSLHVRRDYTICRAVGAVGLGALKTTGNGLHVTTLRRFPRAVALQLPNNFIDVNSAEIGRFSPLRERDISGPVISAHDNKSNEFPNIDITVQTSDPHVNLYDCHGAVNLSSSMQSNVPSPFSGSQSHLGMPGAQWGQGYKYLSEHLNSSHYLTLRNRYRGIHTAAHRVVAPSIRRMSTEMKHNIATPTLKEKFKKAVTEYGSTVIVFHVTISLVSLGTCYLLVSSGLDLPSVLANLNLGGNEMITKAAASNASTFVVAYAVHKVFAPARLALTLTTTPFLVRHLRKIGILKPPTT